MNNKLNKILRTITIVMLWLVLIVAMFKAWDLYQYNKLHPQQEYSWSSMEAPPEEVIIKSNLMKSTKNMILLGILLAIIWEVLLYFNDPEVHFITPIIKKIKPMIEKIEDD